MPHSDAPTVPLSISVRECPQGLVAQLSDPSANAVMLPAGPLFQAVRNLLLSEGWHVEDGGFVCDRNGFWNVVITEDERWMLSSEAEMEVKGGIVLQEDKAPLCFIQNCPDGVGRIHVIREIGTTLAALIDALRFCGAMDGPDGDDDRYESADTQLTAALESGEVH